MSTERLLAPVAAPARVAQANGRGRAATVGRDALAAPRALERAARLAARDAAPPLQAAAAPRRHALASTHQRATVVVRADRLSAPQPLPTVKALTCMHVTHHRAHRDAHGSARAAAGAAARERRHAIRHLDAPSMHAARDGGPFGHRCVRKASRLLACGASPPLAALALSGARAPAVARAVGRAERRLALRAAPAVEARAACLRAAAVAVAPESRAADEIEGVRVSLWHSAAGAIPAVEALALARRHARAVARAPALALRLGAVVTAPSVRARALARRRAVATTRALGRALRNAARRAAPPVEA